MPWSETFKQMLERLHDRVREARQMGMREDEIAAVVAAVGDWLARDAEPRTHEQRLLKELWQACGDDERRVLARALVRLADREVPSALGSSPPPPR